jgi:predicted phosphohydrolase
MVHYPPRLEGEPAGAVVETLLGGGVRAVVYGHLHGADHARAIRGERDGLRYHFVAADAVGFAPLEIPAPDAAPGTTGP